VLPVISTPPTASPVFSLAFACDFEAAVGVATQQRHPPPLHHRDEHRQRTFWE